MDEIARQIGISFSLKAKDAVMNTFVARRSSAENDDSLMENDRMIFKFSAPIKQFSSDDDDDNDTVTTVSLADDSSCCSSSSDGVRSVSFATPLVTAVFERPKTSLDEKRVLFYSERDYREFRRDYWLGKRDRLVKIHEQVVTDVWEVPPIEDPSALYYNETDLQGFLDDFVLSLSK